MSVKLLEGNVKQVKEDYPHLVVGNTIVARKMGFPELIIPCKCISAALEFAIEALGTSARSGVFNVRPLRPQWPFGSIFAAFCPSKGKSVIWHFLLSL